MTDPIELHALADDHLTAAEAHALRERLKHDPEARAELDAILNLRDFLREKTPRVTCDTTWRACVGRMDELDRAKRVEGFVGRWAWALCAGVFLMILTGRYAMTNVQGDTARTADLLQSFSRLVEKPAPVAASVRAKDEWLNAVLGRASQVLPVDRLAVTSGAVGAFDGHRVVRLDLRDPEGRLALFIIEGQLNLQDTAPLPGKPQVYAGEMGGTNCVAWFDRGHTLLLVGPRPASDLQASAGELAIQ